MRGTAFSSQKVFSGGGVVEVVTTGVVVGAGVVVVEVVVGATVVVVEDVVTTYPSA